MNIRLLIAYEGTGYFGWQKTPVGPSIEQTLETALQQLLQEKVVLQAASRTDAGVHALGQVVNFFTHKEFPLKKLLAGANALLPPTIRVREATYALPHFHPTLDSIGKVYHYTLSLGHVQLPHQRHFSWHYPYPIDLNAMRMAAKQLIGRHDFTALCNQRKQLHYPHGYRTLIRLDLVVCEEEQLRFEIEGENFLYKMVRNLVGTLLHVGRGKIAPETLLQLLQQQDRTLMGVTAPAHGLTLMQVRYGQDSPKDV